MLEFQGNQSPSFHLVLTTRNSSGQATGTKELKTDNVAELYEFFLRTKGKPKKKNVHNKPGEGRLIKDKAFVDVTERVVNSD
jgi:hypothetical protein